MVSRFAPADAERSRLRATDEIPRARVQIWTRGPRVGRQAEIIPEADSTTHQVSAVASVPVKRKSISSVLAHSVVTLIESAKGSKGRLN